MHDFCFAAEGELKLTLDQRKHLLKIVAMRRRPTAIGNNHVIEAVPSSRLRPGNKDTVAVPLRDMTHPGTVGACDCQLAAWVVVREPGAACPLGCSSSVYFDSWVCKGAGHSDERQYAGSLQGPRPRERILLGFNQSAASAVL